MSVESELVEGLDRVFFEFTVKPVTLKQRKDVKGGFIVIARVLEKIVVAVAGRAIIVEIENERGKKMNRRDYAQKLHDKWHGKLGQPMTEGKAHICCYTKEPEPPFHNVSCCSHIDCVLFAWGKETPKRLKEGWFTRIDRNGYYGE